MFGFIKSMIKEANQRREALVEKNQPNPAEPNPGRADLLKALGFEKVSEDCEVQPPSGTTKYAFGHTWYYKNHILVGLHTHENAIVEGVGKYPLDSLKPLGEVVSEGWSEDEGRGFYPEDLIGGTYQCRGYPLPTSVITPSLKEGDKVVIVTDRRWGVYTPPMSKATVFGRR